MNFVILKKKQYFQSQRKADCLAPPPLNLEQSLNDEIERLATVNGNLKQEVVRLGCANDLLKKQTHINDVSLSIKEDLKRVKEKGEKNDKNKGKILMKKKSGRQSRIDSYHSI